MFMFCQLFGQVKITSIPVEKGGFEDEESAFGMESKQSVGNTWGAWTFTDKAWGLAEPKDVGDGEVSVILMEPAVITLDVPPALRGQSVELTFIGKGDASFASYHGNDTNYITALTLDKRGKTVRETKLKSIYSDFAGNAKYPAYRKFKVLFPPIPSDASKIAVTINQNDSQREYIDNTVVRKFFIDNVKVRAFGQRFYTDLQPSPFKGLDYELDKPSFSTVWTFEKDKAKLVKDEKTGSMALAIKKDAKLTLKLPAEKLKGKSIELSFKARGTGKVTPEIVLGDGKGDKLKTSYRSLSPLSQDLTTQFAWFTELPDKAVKCELQISASNVAEIQDMKISVSDRPLVPYPPNVHMIPGEKLPPDYFEGRHPSEDGLVNIAPYSEVTTKEFSYWPRAAVDGSLGTVAKGEIEFRYEKPQKVSQIRFTIPQASILIYADTKGNGVYDTPVVENLRGLSFSTWADLPEYVWFRKNFEQPLSVYGIKFIGTANEFQILAKKEDADAIVKEKAVKALAENVPALSLGKEIEVADAKPEDQLRIGFTLESWMFGVQGRMDKYYKSNIEPGNMKDWSEWKTLLADFKQMKANFILMFPPQTNVMPPGVKPRQGAYPTPPMWNSEVWYVSQPFSILKDMAASCRENNITLFTIPRAWMFKEGVANPQVIYAREIAEQGSDGVPVCVDEHAIGTSSPFPKKIEITASMTDAQKEKAEKENARVKSFQTRWNTQELPVKKEDSEIFRKFHIWNLENIAKWMNDINTVSKAVNPKSVTFGGFSTTDYYKDRFSTVSETDLWGFKGNVDVIGGDATYFGVGDALGTHAPAIGIQTYRASTPTRRAMATNNLNWGMEYDYALKKLKNPLVYDDYPSAAYYGGALSVFFNKGEFLDFWRYNYMDMKGPETRKAITRACHMAATLSAWGGKNAQIPKDVMVLRSRASEDWWQLKNMFAESPAAADSDKWWLIGNGDSKPAGAIQTQGLTQYWWLMTQLNEIAIPHEVYYQDQPKGYADVIDKFKVIILPFPYSVSEEEFALLKKASDAGAKIIAFGGCGMGQVNGIGTAYKKPMLEDMVKSGKITMFDIDVVGKPNSSKLRSNFKDTLLKQLGDNRSLTLTRMLDMDVQANVLEVSPTEKLVLLVNWSERDTAVDLGLKMPPGTYKMISRNLDNVTEAKIGGKEQFSEKDLAAFRVNLVKEEAKILRIYK